MSVDAKKPSPIRPMYENQIGEWDMEYDVAIVGFGGAGACAAIEASDAGAKAAVFEVASASGGSTALSSAEVYMGGGGGTRVQKACGYEDDTEDMFNYLMNAMDGLADEAKVRIYCDNSADHFNWLVDKGCEYKDSEYKARAIMAVTDDCVLYTGNEKVWPFKEIAKPCPRGHNLKVEGDNGGPLFMKIMTENVEKRDIDVFYETRALTLIVNDQKQVVGLLIRQDGKELSVKAAKGVILCAGGFCMNEAMVAKYTPILKKANVPIGNPFDTGTGILMGQGVGASLVNMMEAFITMPFYPPSDFTYGIFVNSQGQRFINEDCYHGRVAHHVLRQLGNRVYLIVSAEGFKKPPFLNADIAGTGETIEELAEELEIDAEQLKHTIEFYNKNAKNDEDPLFHKNAEWLRELEAPYAALDCTPGRGALFPFFTLGGLETLPTGEVLDMEGNPIKGLYAAGRTTAGLPRTAAGYASGMSVGDATFFGRMAGKQAASR
jgi:succinate dehydrogenase/fumarate reductase flavoprotein subunit